MREAGGLFLILVGTAFCWVGIHGYQGTGLTGVLNSIFGGIGKVQ